jgi:sugar/nucleoside kinase (ribokinase family)
MNMETADRPQVVCAGILVADLFVPPLPALPAAGQLLATDDFLVDSGGCAANTSTSLARLGVLAHVAGKVGDDIFGTFVLQDLGHKGIDISGISRSHAFGTSKTVILPVIGDDRRFIHTFGANADFRVSDIDLAQLETARIFYVGGYLVLPELRPDELAEVLRSARERGTRTVLDVVVPAGDAAASMRQLEQVLPHVDVFMPNDEEAHRLTGEHDPRHQAQALLNAGSSTVVITKGGRGTLVMDRQQLVEAPAFQVEVVDSSGAGDAFAAGFICGMLEEWSMPDTLRFASAIGASSCTRLGCTPGVFTREQAQAFLRTHELPLKIEAC